MGGEVMVSSITCHYYLDQRFINNIHCLDLQLLINISLCMLRFKEHNIFCTTVVECTANETESTGEKWIPLGAGLPFTCTVMRCMMLMILPDRETPRSEHHIYFINLPWGKRDSRAIFQTGWKVSSSRPVISVQALGTAPGDTWYRWSRLGERRLACMHCLW